MTKVIHLLDQLGSRVRWYHWYSLAGVHAAMIAWRLT